MKSFLPANGFRPFKDLKALLEHLSDSPAPLPPEKKGRDVVAPARFPEKEIPPNVAPAHNQPSPESERALFLEAMSDVTPLPKRKSSITRSGSRKRSGQNIHSCPKANHSLENLVTKGKGFVVGNTPEYMEGTGYSCRPDLARRLHRGEFSIQDHLDLHGLNVPEARHAFDNFLKEAIRTGYRAVLVIHGRGLSSPVKPILKAKVLEWLTTGYWRKWVIAFTSASAVDGGAGATYVLLRTKPLTKRFRKGKKYQRYDLH